MTQQSGYSVETVAPVFPVTDILRSRRYYTERLGFEVDFEWADSDDAPLNYVILRLGKAELHLTLALAANKTAAYFFVDGVENYYRSVSANGATIAQALADQPWEMREFEVADPDGNALIFGEHLSRLSGA